MNARDLSNRLASLLRSEQHALADFLVALAEFDASRAWEELGHASLFSFLHRELGLSKGSAFYRKTAAELVRRFPEVVEPLRDGRLCITSVVELAKVLTPENRDEVLPRFFHRSKQEARALAAELWPEETPPRREVVTRLVPPAPPDCSAPRADALPLLAPPAGSSIRVQPVEPVHANSVDPSWAAAPAPAPAPPPARPAPRDEAEPMTAELSRLHVTVSRRLLAKLDAAKDALSHAKPGASTEDVLEAALDLLLATHARRRAAQVKKPKPARSTPSASPRHVPAAVRREVWARDAGRCQWTLESGGICGSTHRIELDHVTPVARGGPSTAANLRLLCGAHHRLVTRRAFGDHRVLTRRPALSRARPATTESPPPPSR